MIIRNLARRAAVLRPRALPSQLTLQQRRLVQRRGLVAAPKPGDGPIMGRRADRELPDPEKTRFRWSRTLPLFLLICTASSLAIFNYQKASSPVVAGSLYALRTSPAARAELGDEVYFARAIPWISGEMNQLHGRIDVRFRVKGTKGEGAMRFAARRMTARGSFTTTVWCLEMDDGRVIDLLVEEGGLEPMRGIDGFEDPEAEEPSTRGFRQMVPKS